MCIRDRDIRAFLRRAGDNTLERIADAVQQHHRRRDFAHKAVSYTHLRAHETVLDLVCRLLLEKKKTTNTTTHLLDARTATISHL